MKQTEVDELSKGLYRLHWKKKFGGGSSLACVGSFSNGKKWFACANWIMDEVLADDVWPKPGSLWEDWWSRVKKAERLHALLKQNGSGGTRFK